MSNLFDSYSESYAEAVNDSIAFSGLKVDFFIRAKAATLLDIVAKWFPGNAGLSLLDIGCGIGSYHSFWIPHFERVMGVDVSGESIAVAQRTYPSASYAVFDGRALPCSSASFDVAVAICVFHHVSPPERAGLVADIRRVLKPGGLFVIFEHNPLNPLTRHAVNNCPFDADAILLGRRESEQLMRNGGFVDVSSRSILTLPAVSRAARAVDRLLGRLPFGAQFYSVGKAGV